MASLNIPVPDDLREFVDRRARETQHLSPAEYIHELIRQDQLRVEQDRLEKLLIEGLDSGKPISIDNIDDYFAQKKQALSEHVNGATRS